jgi:MFS family permease
MAGTRMAAPLWALSQGYGTAAIGALAALFAVTQIFVAIPAGRFVERRGLRTTIGFGVIAATGGIAFVSVWPSYAALCIAALLSGGAVGASVIAVQHHVGRMAATSEELKRALSWISIAPSISIFIGPLLAGLLIDRFGYRSAFLALATLPLGAWWCVRGVRSVPERTTVHNGHHSPWSLWREAPFRKLLILNWFMTASWDLHAFMVPVLAHERGHLASTIGLILGSFAAAATLSRLLLPALARWVREEFLIAGALTLAGAMFALYPFTRSALTMGLCSFVLGLVLGGIQPTVLIILHHITPAHRQGDALAMRLMTVNASSVVMPMVFGAAGGMFSISSVFWAVAAVVAVGSAFGFSFKKRPGTIE